MTILCGTDFSEAGTQALRVALKLAHKKGAPLHVGHATAFSRVDRVAEKTRAEIAGEHRNHLEQQIEALKAPGQHVFIHVGEGPADELMLRLATELSASLIVVGAVGERHPTKWQLGSHADRLAQRSHAPVLVVRNGGLEEWVSGARPLRIVLGADLTGSTIAAMRWIDQLAQLGPCEVIATYQYWPPEQYTRLGLGGVRDYIEPVPAITEALQRELSSHLAADEGAGIARFRIEPHLGRIGDKLASVAREENADLVVVGSHARRASSFWEGSVSRTTLRESSCSVACVPAPEHPAAAALPALRSVLVATDFSATGNSAVALACAAAAPGATIHIVHAVPAPQSGPTAPRDLMAADQDPSRHNDLRAMLANLLPRAAVERGQHAELHVLESNKPAEAIAQAAERLGAGLICIGTHGRTGLAKAFLGSVAQEVVARSGKPVLLARPPAL